MPRSSNGGQGRATNKANRGTMTQDELVRIVANHQKWLQTDGKKGELADLSNCDLRHLDFRGADLRSAILRNAELSGADLHELNLTSADLCHAQLSDCNLQGAVLRECNLTGANLHNAQLAGSDLYGAILHRVDLTSVNGLAEWQLAGADLSNAKLLKDTGTFVGLGQIADISVQARNLLWVAIGACLFAGVTAFITTDGIILAHSGSTLLPLVQMNVPISKFFWLMPLILLGLYLYLHFHLQYLWNGLASLPAVFPDGVGVDERAYPLFLVGLIRWELPILRKDQHPLCSLQAYSSIIVAWCLIPITVFLFWLRYLPMHDLPVTIWHIVLLTAVTWFGLETYRGAAQALRGEGRATKSVDKVDGRSLVRSVHRIGEIILAAAVGIACLSVSLIAAYAPPWMPEYLRPWTCADFSYADISHKPDDWLRLSDENRERLLGVKGALLKNVNLRGAKGIGAFLPGATLTNADLRNADFSQANLSESSLYGAMLQGADLSYSDFRGAVFGKAELQGTNFRNAKLHAANLGGAILNRTNLYGAQLQGATLEKAQLKKAILAGTNLARANLEGAVLHETDFGGAWFQVPRYNTAGNGPFTSKEYNLGAGGRLLL